MGKEDEATEQCFGAVTSYLGFGRKAFQCFTHTHTHWSAFSQATSAVNDQLFAWFRDKHTVAASILSRAVHLPSVSSL